MRNWFARRPSPAMAVAFVALLAALSGTAVALPGKNTVDSGDIKNRQVKGKDIANNAVTGAKIKSNAVTGTDVSDSSLTGADVLDDSLTGADVNEGTLGKVPSAAAADTASTATSAGNADKLDGRDPAELLPASAVGENTVAIALDGTMKPIVSATIDLPYPSRIMATAYVEISADGGDNDAAACRIVDETGEVNGSGARPSPQVPDTQFDIEVFPINALTAQRAAGPHTVSVECLETGGTTSGDDARLILSAVR